MFEGIIAGALILLVITLPIKWSFSLALAVSFSLFYYLVSDVSTAMFVLIAIRIVVRTGFDVALRTQLFRAHIVLIAFGALSILWASSYALALSKSFAQIKVLIIGAICLQLIQKREDIKYLVFGISAGVFYIILSLTGWKYGFFGVSSSLYIETVETYGRLLTQYLHPDRHTPINSNTWSALTAISLGIICVYFTYFNKKRTLRVRWIMLLLLLIITFVTLDLASRAGLMALAVVSYLLFFYIKPQKFYRNIAILGLLFYTGTLSVSLIGEIIPNSAEVIHSRLAESEQEDPRVKIWQTGIAMAADNILIGVGLGNSGLKFKNYMTARLSSDQFALHNSFLTHLAELGIVGLVLFLRLFYLWQKPRLFSKFTKALFIVVSFCILLNAMTHSFELENYFIAIIYVTHKVFLLEEKNQYSVLQPQGRELMIWKS